MKKVVSVVLCLLLFVTSVPVFAADANSLPEPVVYYNFDGDDVLKESLNDGAYDGKATIGDLENFDGASIAQVDSMEGYGKAAKFTEEAKAVGSFVQLPAGMMPENLDGDFTFSFWFKGDTGTMYTTVFCFGYTGVNYYIKLSFNGTKQLWAEIRDANNAAFSLGNTVETGSLVDGTDGWHFYTLTCERGNGADVVKYYIDGSLIEQKADVKLPVYSEITTENNAFNMLGEAFWPDPIVGGLLDEFRIYDSALDAEQVNTLKTNPFPAKEYTYPEEEMIIATVDKNMDIGPSGDNYGMVFEDLAAGVYKVAYYMTIDSVRDGAQMRISPRVGNYRCWIDWKTTVEMNGHTAVKPFMEANDTNKVILVNVIKVPENGLSIDAGFWQDENAYVGTLDKVVLATDGYDFINDTEYTWVDEKGYRGNEPETTFGEDSEQKLLAVEGDWVMSTRPGDDDGTGDDGTNGGNTGDGSGDGSGDEEQPPVTGDVSLFVAIMICLATLAVISGLKQKRIYN